MLVEPNRLKADIKSRPPVLLVHGDRDEVIPVQALQQARTALAEAGVPSNGMSPPACRMASTATGWILPAASWSNAFKP